LLELNGKVKKDNDVLIMAQEGNTNHVVSQLDTLTLHQTTK
jgi:hypothetical protein